MMTYRPKWRIRSHVPWLMTARRSVAGLVLLVYTIHDVSAPIVPVAGEIAPLRSI